MSGKLEAKKQRDALFRTLILSGAGLLMLVVEGETWLGWLSFGAAAIVFIAQYVVPRRRQRASEGESQLADG